MKKIIYTITLAIFFILTGNEKIAASNGTCIISQQDLTYEINTPFYWYHVTYEKLHDNAMVSTENYYHTYKLIQDKKGCEGITGNSPTYEMGINQNALNNRTTTYYFNSELLTDSKQIYTSASSLFKKPTIFNKVGFEITGTFISLDDMPPIIATDNTNAIIIVNVNEKVSIDSIKEKISAYDEVDGIIEVKLYEDNYSSNYKTLGTYPIVFSATDKSGNIAKLTINIKVIDSTPPTITGQKNLISYMSNPLTLDQIKNSLSINDNYDTNLKNLIIKQDNYSSNLLNEGTFDITFITFDNSNNESSPHTISINIIDDIVPIISGNTSYTVNIKNLLETSTIIEQLTVIDNIDNSPSLEIINDTYTSNFYKVGIYQISIVAKDKNNNQSIPFIINIVTEDTEEPIFYISQKFIGVNSSFEVPIEDLIEIVNEINNITSSNIIHTSIVENTYSENSAIPGTYKLTLKYQCENNEEIILESNIVVSNYLEKNKNTPKKTLWSVIKSFILKIWNYIKQFFMFFRKLI